MLVFEGKTGVPVEKPLGAEKRTSNKLNPHVTPGPGIKPGTHWWEASALTTAPSLLHQKKNGLLLGRTWIFLREVHVTD